MRKTHASEAEADDDVPLRVAVVGPSLGLGGMEKATAEISGALSSAGATTFCIPIFDRRHFTHLSERVTLLPSLSGQGASLHVVKSLKVLRGCLRQHDIESAIGIGVVASAFLGYASAGLPLTYAATERVHPDFRWPLRIRAFAQMAFTVNRPSLWVTQSKYAESRALARNVPARRVLTIPNIVRNDVVTQTPLPREEIILVVGRLGDRQKGLDVVLASWARIRSKRGWRLCIVGAAPGPLGEQQAAALRSSSDGVEVFEASETVGEWFARASIFVLPSRGEGFPNALLEAMATGCAVVSTEYHPGVHEIVEDGVDGIVVPPDDPAAMADAIVRLMNDPCERALLGAVAMNKATKHSPEVIGKQLYAALIEARDADVSRRAGLEL